MEKSSFFSATPDEVALFSYLWGVALARPLTIEEQNVLGNIFFLTGQTIFAIASVRTLQAVKKNEEEKQKSAKKPKQKPAPAEPPKNQPGTIEKKEPPQPEAPESTSEIEQLKKDIRSLRNEINQLKNK